MTAPIAYSAVTALQSAFPNPQDGQMGKIRVGTGIAAQDIRLIFNADVGSSGTWIGYDELELVRTEDQWSLDVVGPASPGAGFWQTKQPLRSHVFGNPSNTNFTSKITPRNVGACFTAGLSLQYRHMGFIKGDGSHNTNIGACFYQFNDGDTLSAAQSAITQPNAIAETTYLNGGVAYASGVAPFQWQESGWAALTFSTTPTKTALFVQPFGYMDAGAVAGGGVLTYSLFVRWVI